MCGDANRVHLQFRYSNCHVRVGYLCVLCLLSMTPGVFLLVLQCCFSIGPVCSILVEHFGCRTTIMVGGVLSGLGMVVSSFAQTILELYIATGVIAGESCM